MAAISQAECNFIQTGVVQNVRNDGRSRMDFRSFDVEQGVITHASGSAKVRLAKTEVIVTINFQIEEPCADKPNEGMVQCSVECCPAASLAFQGDEANEINVILSAHLERIIASSNCIDKRSLCIIPGKQCWMIYVDALVMSDAGNVLDAVGLAVKAALADAVVPKVEVIEGETPEDTTIEVNDDPFECARFSDENTPVCVTLAKIGNCFVVDPSKEEEHCSVARVTVGINSSGNICGVYKFGVGGIASSALVDMLACAQKVGSELLLKLSKHDNRRASYDEDELLESKHDDH